MSNRFTPRVGNNRKRRTRLALLRARKLQRLAKKEQRG